MMKKPKDLPSGVSVFDEHINPRPYLERDSERTNLQRFAAARYRARLLLRAVRVGLFAAASGIAALINAIYVSGVLGWFSAGVLTATAVICAAIALDIFLTANTLNPED
jgi:hypothetical protein